MDSIFGIFNKSKKCRYNPLRKKDKKKTITNINALSKYQFGFRKWYGTQQCLLVIIEKWPQSSDKGGDYSALYTDLSKAFDCLSHDLLIEKLHAYDFDIPALRLPHNHLTNRKQSVKIFI